MVDMTVENKTSFFARLDPMLSKSEATRVRGAYVFAKFGHRAQKRKELDEDGERLRYFEHCRRTALILIDELHIYDVDLICTGLLHDCLEDTLDVTADIIELFQGSRVCRWVTQLSKVPKEGYFERLKYADEESLIVKACDRVDNLRSFPDREMAIRKIEETIKEVTPPRYAKAAELLMRETRAAAKRFDFKIPVTWMP